jgi:hypothetical protein
MTESARRLTTVCRGRRFAPPLMPKALGSAAVVTPAVQ